MRVETNLVTCDVLVLDKQEKLIQGLAANDFKITDEGQPQTISTFALGDDAKRPRSIVLIIDYSGSQLPFLKASVDAAKTLVEQLNQADRMAIVTDDVALLVDFTTDKKKLKAALDSLVRKVVSGKSLGRSRQYSALMATLKELVDGESRPIVIFQTNGDEIGSLQPLTADAPPHFIARAREFSLADIVSEAERTHTTVYAVVPGFRLVGFPPNEQAARVKKMFEAMIASHPPSLQERLRKQLTEGRWLDTFAAALIREQTALLVLSKLTGGWSDFLESPDDSAQIYARILSDINRRYILGFQPTNKEHDGKRRKLSIEVRGHPEYIVWGRKFYYEPGGNE